jgi:histidine triad (HIT) family protein
MPECVFCRIVRRELPCHELLRTESVIAFLDRNPLSRGHALVVPCLHVTLMQDLSEDMAAELGRVLHRLAPVVCRLVDAPAATLALHDGREAGQEVPHVHWHIVPRTAGDGGGPIHALFRKRPHVTEAEQAALADRVRVSLLASGSAV